ncbi:LANO_0H16072g1_1 [Lachancea nothofagi CBS 11611]|uniref:LANO_0H16072g1_1 n=1 Tax=Lachancea nothofagi CBS 11611 TaxID=1266666 RepID=A0A1G4KMN2_9SACH|nr:LANO_0H16072g1_1 [Lachancea nothofagi CBS 11611]
MKISSIAHTLVAACGLVSAYGYANQTVTTLTPSSGAVITETTEYTSKGSDYTSTVTLMTTITMSGDSSASVTSAPASQAATSTENGSNENNKGVGALSAGSESTTSEVWSTITSTLYTTQSVTLSNSQVSTSVSAYEKQIVIGTSMPSCTPQTVTVTQDKTQYVTVTAGAVSSSGAVWSPSSATYANTTLIQ